MSADRDADGLPGGAARTKDVTPSKLYLVPFVGEGVGAPSRVEGAMSVTEATTIFQRGEGVFISAPSAGHAHRMAQRVLEARVMLRQLRESSDAYREGYASALREAAAFISSEVTRWEGKGTTAIAEDIRAARHETLEAVSTWLAGRL